MWKQTEVARRLGLSAPIVQGPFGSGLSSVELLVAVSEAGLLGSFGAHHLSGAAIRDLAAAIRARTARPFALNLWLPFADSEDPQLSDAQFAAARERLRPYFEELGVELPARPERFTPRYAEQIEAVLEARPAAFSFIYGVPSPEVMRACHERGILTVGTVTTPAEAQLLEQAGVDMIVASGFEAGGHRVSFLREPEESLTGTLALIPQVVDAVRVPVIAAGGIADGRGIAAALMLGAQGVQIGTAFLACEESAASPLHRDRLFSTGPTQTALTRAFTGRLARGLRNRFLNEMADSRATFAPYPVQAWLTAQLRATALKRGRDDLLSLWSGQSAPLLRHRRARDLIGSLLAETDSRLAPGDAATKDERSGAHAHRRQPPPEGTIRY
jgi:nitronate monooxygenase